MSPVPRPVRMLVHSFMVVRPEPDRPRRAVRWVAAVAFGLLLASFVFGPERGPMGLIGAMAANAGREDPLRRRVTAVLVVGLTTLACQALGILAAPYPWLLPPLVTVVTLLIVWAWHALMVGPPGPTNACFALAFGSYLGGHGYSLGSVMPIAALAWAGSAAASIVLLMLDRHGAQRDAVDAAESAVSIYRDRPADASPEQANDMRTQAYLAVDDAWRVLRDDHGPRAWRRSGQAQALEERLRGVHHCLLDLLGMESFPAARSEVAEDLRRVPLGRPSTRYLLRSALTRGSRPRLVAGRTALAVLLASSTMFVSPVGHPYWAVLSALIVLHMGASRADLTIRSAHRVVGTGVGLVVYYGIVLVEPQPWVKVAIVIVSIYLLECFVTRNYALSVVFVTVFALMMTPVTSKALLDSVLRDRLVETVIGVSMAVLVIWLVGRRAPVLLVRSQYRRTMQVMVDVLADLASDDLVSRSARADRRDLVFELERAGGILTAQRQDAPDVLARWLSVQEQVTSFGFDVAAACWRNRPEDRDAAALAHAGLRALINALPPVSTTDIDTSELSAQLAELNRQFRRESALFHRPRSASRKRSEQQPDQEPDRSADGSHP